MLIYKITNDVNDKLYIGQTTKSLEERIAGHRNSMVSGVNTHIYNAMRKYGWEHFHFEIVVDNIQDQDTLNDLEAYYIAKWDTIVRGYNMAKGGSINPMYSAVVRAKHDSIMRSDDVRNRIRDTVKSRIAENGISEEHRRKLSVNKKAFYASPEGEKAKAKFRASFSLSPEHYAALNDAKNKEVYCIDQQGNEVARFKRVKDAAVWWYSHGYDTVKSPELLSDAIKLSSKEDRYIRGLKWIYCV